MASPNKKKRDKRQGINQPLGEFTPMKIGNRNMCVNCGEEGSHYFPPSLNDSGGFICNTNRLPKAN